MDRWPKESAENLKDMYYLILYLQGSGTPATVSACPLPWKSRFLGRNLRLLSVSLLDPDSISLGNLLLNSLLDEIRLRDLPNGTSIDVDTMVLGKMLMTSFYTIQEFAPYALYGSIVSCLLGQITSKRCNQISYPLQITFNICQSRGLPKLLSDALQI